MKFDVSAIKNSLADGATLDELASELTTLLNQAKEEYDAEVAAAKEAEEKAKREKEERAASLKELVTAIGNYLITIGHPVEGQNYLDKVDDEAFLEVIDGIVSGLAVSVEDKPGEKKIKVRCGFPSGFFLDELLRW